MTVPVATKHEKRPSAWSFLLQHVAALFKGGHYTSNRPNGISGADHLCNGDLSPVTDSDLPPLGHELSANERRGWLDHPAAFLPSGCVGYPPRRNPQVKVPPANVMPG